MHFNILFSHVHPSLQSGLLPSDIRSKGLYAPPPSPIPARLPTHLIFLDLITRMIFGEEYNLYILGMWSSPIHCYFFPFGPKCLSQHHILYDKLINIIIHCATLSRIPT